MKKLVLKVIRKLKLDLAAEVMGISTLTPWMRDWEIGLCQTLLQKLQPKRCLEWGGGGSTLSFPKLLSKDSSWLTIEHNQEWADTVRQRVKFQNFLRRGPAIEIVYIPAHATVYSDVHGDGTYLDFKDYVDYPCSQSKFDYIFVDGRARTACLEKAVKLINPEGVVILHDAGRTYYHEAFAQFPFQLLFLHPTEEEVGLWIGSFRSDLKELVSTPQNVSALENCRIQQVLAG